jgi:RNA polymerase sigma factor (sigma-70 family)
MITTERAPVLRHLRRLALGQGAGDVSDQQLLQFFLSDRDDAAFAALVRRHGPMVLGVCRRLLRDHHDAEDAFQATFLVLLRKAHAIAEPERLGNWLYGVAFHTAQNARLARLRRRAAEGRLRELARTATQDRPADEDWRPVLDLELSGLPERYRVPLVLCGLQGRSREEAARQLGWSEGTLSSRLARGRALLRDRLQRRGLIFSTPGLIALLTTQTAAAVPAGLVQSTAQAAGPAGMGIMSSSVIALMEGVLQAMFLTKLKMATAWLVIVGILGLGAAVLTQQALADKPANAAQQAKNAGEKPKADAGASLSGVIVSIDADKTITVTTGDKNNQQQKTYPLAKDVKVLLRDGRTKNEPATEGKLAHLEAGMHATLHLSADEKTVAAVTPAPLKEAGAVKSVDAAQNTLTIQTKDKSGGAPAEKTFSLTPDTKILLNDGLKKDSLDTEGKLTDLSEGTHVLMQISLLDKTKVIAVRVQGASIHGEVKGLDLGSNTITLTVKEDAQIVDKTITLAKDARVDTDLTPGDRANVRLSVFDKTKAVAVHKMKSKDGQEKE